MASLLGRPRLSCVAASLLVATSCANYKEAGILGGMAAGAAAGAAAAPSDYKAFGFVIGAVAGAVAGAFVGAKLDEADRARAEASALQAVEGPAWQRIGWNSENMPNTYGYAEVIAVPAPAPIQNSVNNSGPADRPAALPSYQPPTPTAVSASGPERECKIVREVVVLQGRESKEEAQFCRAGSQWVRS